MKKKNYLKEIENQMSLQGAHPSACEWQWGGAAAQAAFTTSVRWLKNQNQQRSHQGSNHFTAPATSAPKISVLHLSWSSLSTLLNLQALNTF